MRKIFYVSFALTVLLVSMSVLAQDVAVTDQVIADTPEKLTLWGIVGKGGLVGYIILGMSVCATALVVEHMLTIRKSALLPEDISDDIREHISNDEIEQAIEICDNYDNLLTRVLSHGLSQRDSIMGYYDVEKAVEEAARRETGILYRKIEYLTFIANTSPMLGLLGTVTGMISAFNYISALEGASRSSQLAGAISEALVTTCLGLIVAIPSLFFIAVFRNRIDGIMTEAEILTESILSPIKNKLKGDNSVAKQ